MFSTFSFSHMGRDELAQSMPCEEEEGEAKEEEDKVKTKAKPTIWRI